MKTCLEKTGETCRNKKTIESAPLSGDLCGCLEQCDGPCAKGIRESLCGACMAFSWPGISLTMLPAVKVPAGVSPDFKEAISTISVDNFASSSLLAFSAATTSTREKKR